MHINRLRGEAFAFTMTQWKLFDFDTHFDAFWDAWNKDDVQSALHDVMEEWCAEHAYPNEDGSRPTWRRGDPLWHLSISDAWQTFLDDAVMKRLPKSPYALYKRTMEASRLPVMDEYAYHDMVLAYVCRSDEYTQLVQEYEPKPGTLDSLVMFGGETHLAFPLALCARHMFPGATIILGENVRGKFVLMPDEGIVFDLVDFYDSTRRGLDFHYDAFDQVAELVAASDDV